ncbi:MAG: Na+/H+ antiporter NhaA [Chitinophagales bacterium]|jgi:NhaA family Na+:H+ antiporter|nr:Na+/H+ antiporter NhaA [Chitinophagales bacterium]
MIQRAVNLPMKIVFKPIQKFIQQEKSAGLILAINVLLAFIWANLSVGIDYEDFFHQKFGFFFNGKLYFNYDLHHWINDGLMSIFFFVVGLELKREFVAGELSQPKKALVPFFAAIGGMIVPAIIYILLNPSGDVHKGWGIPMATDIAFALAVMSLLGDKIPLSLKIFLTALAIVDDLGAVLVIALFYSSDISTTNLLLGLGFIIFMYSANKAGIRNLWFYALFGIFGGWVAFMLSGVHATIAGVLAAFTIPADVRIDETLFGQKINKLLLQFNKLDADNSIPTLTNEQLHVLDMTKKVTNDAIPPLQRLELLLHPLVSYLILPIFALSNSGVNLQSMSWDLISQNNVCIGIFLGLLLGKTIGVSLFSYLAVTLKLGSLSPGLNMKHIFGVGLLSSIGFTMSLFVANLAFEVDIYKVESKIGIFSASLLGGLLGYLYLSQFPFTSVPKNDKLSELSDKEVDNTHSVAP